MLFLRIQAIGYVRAQRLGMSPRQARKHFDTACDVEFKLAREADEDDTTYQSRCRQHRKVARFFPFIIIELILFVIQMFWSPAFQWALDMLRYRRQVGGIWQPVALLAADIPTGHAAGPRPRPRPSFNPTRCSAEKSVGPSVTASPSSAPVVPSATASSSKKVWPSPAALAKIQSRYIQRRGLRSLEHDEMEEMKAVAAMLRDYEPEGGRWESPEL